jgi:hypothetical protein
VTVSCAHRYFELEVKSHGGVISFKSGYIHFRQHPAHLQVRLVEPEFEQAPDI